MARGSDLAGDIQRTYTTTPTLWWLGHGGFAVKFANLLFYLDPCLTTPPGRSRLADPPIRPEEAPPADMILCTHPHAGHMDPGTLLPILRASVPKCKIVMPKSAAAYAHSQAIPYERMTTTDSALRVEYFKDGLYGRVYSVPSAHPDLAWHPIEGHPALGYLVRFERTTIYHAGDCRMYPELAMRLKPYSVTVALLPIGGNNFSIQEAAQLAEEIGAHWVVPMHYGTLSEPDDPSGERRVGQFVEHMLGHRPGLPFKVFEPGEKWTVPNG